MQEIVTTHSNTEKMLMKKMILLTVACWLVAAASAQAADVKENWEKQCVKCHGPEGKGDTKMGKKVGVKDYTDAKIQAEMKDDAMFKAIKEGLKEGDKTQMKPYNDVFSDVEIKALVAYVRTLKK